MSTRRGWFKWGLAIVGVVVAINVGLTMLRNAFGGPEGPPSSSYATDDDGTAAYAELLAAEGFGVAPLRGSLADGVPRVDTLLVLDPEQLAPDEVDALKAYVADGGRLVIGGNPEAWLPTLVTDPPEPAPDGPTSVVPLAQTPETAGVGTVTTDGSGAFTGGSSLPILGDRNSNVAAVATAGEGRIVLLATTSMLDNARLGAADNAAFGIDIAGAPGSSVMFAEGVHGYGTATGLAALPFRWRVMLLGMAIAALVWMVAAGRRIGAPEDSERDLPPPRSAYIEALATTLARTRKPAEAVEPVRAAARAALARRAGLPHDASETEYRRVAAASRLTEEEVEAIFSVAGSTEAVTAAGRALVRLEEFRW
ncbi:MAG TPA: DUF4350 domain-containing protein [Actinomycetota bacterium]|nr:DUF4350 domain-containing protein [Actinomycetota bacterium]